MQPVKPASPREERLAQQLRENLRRRKAQARALSGAFSDEAKDALPKSPPTG